MKTRIAHVDLDAFFASCEQRDNPDYRGLPVIVGALPGRRGVVAACSYEARVYGIHSAMPVAEAYRRCPDGIYVRPDMEKYREISRQIMTVLENISPVVEKASVDEAYLDLTGLTKYSGSPQTIGSKIRSEIFAHTGLTASVGIGPNRLIAKLGSEDCKPDGLRVVEPKEVLDFLGPMPVGNLRGLGKQTHKIMDRLGITTIAELRNSPLSRLKKHLGEKTAIKFHRQANGIASARVEGGKQRKSLSKETTFDSDVEDQQVLLDTLLQLATGIARSLRKEQLAGTVVTLKIRYRGFTTVTRQITLAQPTADERTILNTARKLFADSDLPRKPVRLIGIGLSNWETVTESQPDLFTLPEQTTANQKILETIDTVTEKFGKPVLQVGMPKTRHKS